MLVNQDTCDECGARIEPRQKAGDWRNILTAKAHICEGCWKMEMDRTLEGIDSWEGVNNAIRENKFPAETFVGKAIEDDDIVRKVMSKYGNVSKTT